MTCLKWMPAAVLCLICSMVQAEALPNAAYLKDPTAPLNVVESGTAAEKTLSLTAIFQRAGLATAIINGKSVRVGDRVGDLLVTKISKDAVYLQGRAPVVLSLYTRVIDKRQVEK